MSTLTLPPRSTPQASFFFQSSRLEASKLDLVDRISGRRWRAEVGGAGLGRESNDRSPKNRREREVK